MIRVRRHRRLVAVDASRIGVTGVNGMRPFHATAIVVRVAVAFVIVLTGACAVDHQPGSTIGQAEASPAVTGWLGWRGPGQNGVSYETNLPDVWLPGDKAAGHLWSIDLPGRGTPVIARHGDEDRVYVWGYEGSGPDVREVLLCLDAASGREIWRRAYSDFISDIIYDRYSIGAPTVDGETGNVYLMTSPGLLVCLDRDGTEIWQRSMMEEFGRLTFPNGRTGAPAIDGELVIVNCISSNWGREGPGRNRFYAFDKKTGELVWSSTPGVGPPFLRDSSFSIPVFEWRNGKRVFYVGTGCGNIVAVNARTGQPLWRYQLAVGGINSSVVMHKDKLIAIHGKENIDDTGRGRMIAIDIKKALDHVDAVPVGGAKQLPVKLDKSYELWRNDDLSMFTSSPVVVGDRIYQVTMKGDLVCVDANTGQSLWHIKLGADQLHASPLYADGKLYVPTWHDGFYIIRPTDTGGQILDHVQLDGACLGSPSVWNGQIYLHTMTKLYCFGGPGGEPPAAAGAEDQHVAHSQGPSSVGVIPCEVLMRPGSRMRFRLRRLDHLGQHMDSPRGGVWRKFIPPAAKVRSFLDADFNDVGEFVATAQAKRSAGAFEVDVNREKGYMRGRILPSPPYAEDFESFNLVHVAKDGTPFAYPPLPWIGARLKWEVRDVNGDKVLAKTLDRILFQRSMVFIGHADDRGYTIAVDVMTDGNRRIMSTGGVVNQRYIIAMVGNAQILEIISNHDRVKASVPFSWQPKKWYRLKTRVDVNDDGSGVVRAKAWRRGQPEPASWTIELPQKYVHRHGSPGLFGFSPQSQFSVYIDNVSVRPNR